MGCLKLEHIDKGYLKKINFSLESAVERKGNANFFRLNTSPYGFGGMEADNEVKGNGNSYTTEFRQYDPRIGRWLSLDPAMNLVPSMSPYVAFNNNPIFYTDPNGDLPPPFGYPNNAKAQTLDPFTVRNRNKADIANGNPIKYQTGLWDIQNGGLSRVPKTKNIFTLVQKNQTRYYGRYFMPEIKTNADGSEYADEKYGTYVMVELEATNIHDKSLVAPYYESDDLINPKRLPVSTMDRSYVSGDVAQQMIDGINSTFENEKQSLIGDNEFIDPRSFSVTSIDIKINTNAPKEFKDVLISNLTEAYKGIKLNITEETFKEDSRIFESSVNFDYTQYTEK